MSEPYPTELLPILLTASIDPKGRSFVRRADPRVREQDYIAVIRRLVAETRHPIVFCENSGYSLDMIRKALQGRREGEWEILQFDGQNFPPERGKGYGELCILQYAIAHSKLLQSSSLFIKLTGRYYVENLAALSCESEKDPTALLYYWRLTERYAYSAFFIARTSFIAKYLAQLLDRVDDSKKMPLEIVMRDAVRLAETAGERVGEFQIRPIVTGVSGTWNVLLDKRAPNQIAWSMPRLHSVLRSYAASARRALARLSSR